MRCACLDETELKTHDQSDGKFDAGDRVFVPNAVDHIWQPELTTVEKVASENGNTIYYAKCTYKNPIDNSSRHEKRLYAFDEKEVFATLSECKEYISNHYYDGLCKGCKYDDKGGAVYFCRDCEYCRPYECSTEPSDERHGNLVCMRTGVVVGNRYRMPGHEICKYYKPTLLQNIKDYGSWESYNDVLRNCDFNQKCRHHARSAHKTCTYERYMDQIITIPYSFEFNGRKVEYVRIHRWQWLDQTFIDMEKQTIKCVGLDYHCERNRRNKPKKTCESLREWFGDIVTINISNGKFDSVSDGV